MPVTKAKAFWIATLSPPNTTEFKAIESMVEKNEQQTQTAKA